HRDEAMHRAVARGDPRQAALRQLEGARPPGAKGIPQLYDRKCARLAGHGDSLTRRRRPDAAARTARSRRAAARRDRRVPSPSARSSRPRARRSREADRRPRRPGDHATSRPRDGCRSWEGLLRKARPPRKRSSLSPTGLKPATRATTIAAAAGAPAALPAAAAIAAAAMLRATDGAAFSGSHLATGPAPETLEPALGGLASMLRRHPAGAGHGRRRR